MSLQHTNHTAFNKHIRFAVKSVLDSLLHVTTPANLTAKIFCRPKGRYRLTSSNVLLLLNHFSSGVKGRVSNSFVKLALQPKLTPDIVLFGNTQLCERPMITLKKTPSLLTIEGALEVFTNPLLSSKSQKTFLDVFFSELSVFVIIFLAQKHLNVKC